MKIASRTLMLQGRAGAVAVPVDVFAPEPDGNGWICRYQIQWPQKPWSSFGAGLDAVQALAIALQKIGVEIYSSDYHRSGLLAWGEPGSGYGFPVPASARDLLIGDDVKYY